MIFEICAILALITFSILSAYLIITLVAARETLRNIDILTQNLNTQIKHAEPILRSLNDLGDFCTEKTLRREEYLPVGNAASDNLSDDLVAWALISLKLGNKLLRRK